MFPTDWKKLPMDDMVSVKQIFLEHKGVRYCIFKEELVLKCFRKWLKKKKTKTGDIDKRGKEINYRCIAKKTGLSYMQARRIVDKLCKQGIIEKWSRFDCYGLRHNYYRLLR